MADINEFCQDNTGCNVFDDAGSACDGDDFFDRFGIHDVLVLFCRGAAISCWYVKYWRSSAGYAGALRQLFC